MSPHESIKQKIRTIPDFPKKGVMFRDITTLLKDPKGFADTINAFYQRYKNYKIDAVAGIEARGFILGGALAYKLGVGFIPIRKKGKLPAAVEREEYDLEYGKDSIEIHKDAVKKGQKILLVDDLLATGGTANAAIRLIEKLGGEVLECAFIVDLPEVHKVKLPRPVFFLVEFEDE
ncbi:TPA: adenine phosphoribosyltransferase [archaeon]|nr:adenine phosphoribosyltransferase [Candidatus Naiadarchaeales archaeon SRR2090153.bin1042]